MAREHIKSKSDSSFPVQDTTFVDTLTHIPGSKPVLRAKKETPPSTLAPQLLKS
jgi:hypothetical protein